MRRVFKYGFFRGMDPVCPSRIAEYPELEYVRSTPPDMRPLLDREDLTDAQHQWAYVTVPQLMQRCFEEGCHAVRPTPLYAYPSRDQMFIMQEFMRRQGVAS